ncbi:MAG: hypothetical protein AAFV53_31255, partial [Myxococcota bacterium]
STEYSWGIDDPFAGVKCDPCPPAPPERPDEQPILESELSQLGMLDPNAGWYVTRLRLRYTADGVPEDLMFYTSGISSAREQVRYIVHRWELEGLLPTCDEAPEDPGSCYTSAYWMRASAGELEPIIGDRDYGRWACRGEGRSRALLLVPLALVAVGARRRRR